MRVLHISDVHITPRERRPMFNGGWRCALAQVELRLMGRGEKFAHAREALCHVLDEAGRLDVDHVVLTGDLTSLGLEEEFEQVREMLGAWAGDRGRLTVVPGNHDRFTPRSATEGWFERYFLDHLRSDIPLPASEGHFPFVRLLGDHVALVGLDSSLLPLFPGLAFGRVGEHQLGLLQTVLRDHRLAGRAVLVVTHHGPYDVSGRPEPPSRRLLDFSALLNVCGEGRVTGWLHGHVHHRFRLLCPRYGVPIFSGGSSTELGREGYFLYELGGAGEIEARSVSTSFSAEPCRAGRVETRAVSRS